MSKNILFASIIAITLLITGFSNSNSFAESLNTENKINPINNSIGIQKSIIQIDILQNNNLPWGFVEGTIENHVSGYPVIIQIFDNDKSMLGNNHGAIHFAQTNVNEDGSYEYKFRVLNSDYGDIKANFEGNYTVKIFKVVYLDNNLTAI